ncbi:E3 ubiquitin-protein ligase MARCH8-like isoform X4 [Durio zibethinus]|uniref:E3 ubiquitin-protein ligase MARCH8-like isoform X4 n=1 Tax=Durio zibethinus TaxID=66656 RepID=A0A6P5X7L0_DURZI|nr:E3 ubiquitin-protein ligase MARCH8-like isoform X4 [Durio zibethinus]
MQLVSNDSQKEDISESEPILCQSDISQRSEECSSSSEITTVEGYCVVVSDDLEDINADETSHLVNADQPQCRICLDIEGDDLIAPCHCKGTQKYVHRSCLDNWRSTKIVAFLGVLVYKFYGEELREMFGYDEHPYGFYTISVLAIVLVGLLYGFFIAIICGQRINERHYHILAKQELTKEYVVEDREDNKNIPDLDPSHVTELRMLGLY